MNLKTPKNSNYAAVVVEIKTLVPLENCDNVQGAPIMGQHVIVGKDIEVGEVGLYFPLESQLTKEYLSANNLYRDKTLNSDQTKVGYFDVNGRIRCQKFRGHDSEGLFMPINSIRFTGVNPVTDLKMADEFDELNDIEICRKYIVKDTKIQGTPGSKKDRNMNDKMKDKMVENQFKFHQDTSILYKNTHKISADTIVHLSYKEHGCVSSDTIINTLQGDYTIKEIVNNKLEVDVKAFDINTGEIVYVPIDDYFLLENDGDWYEIELEDGCKLNITSHNPVWLPELSCYRKTEELMVGDLLLVDL